MDKIIINEMGMRYVKIPFLKGEKSEYEENILKHTNISGLAEVAVQEIDGNIYFLYPIYSYISLKERFDRDLLNVDIFVDFFGQLLKVYEKIQMYLLDGKEICLDPELIFYNHVEKKYIFLPIIGEKKSFSENYEMLFTFFADKCPLEEKKLLGFIFENFIEFSDEQFEPITFLKYVMGYNFEDETEIVSEAEENESDFLTENNETEFEKSKSKAVYLSGWGFLMLAILFSYMSDMEIKYGIVSIAASFLAVGITAINFFRIHRTDEKSQPA